MFATYRFICASVLSTQIKYFQNEKSSCLFLHICQNNTYSGLYEVTIAQSQSLYMNCI